MYWIWILISEAVGGLSGFLSRNGMKAYNQSAVKPSLSPPPVVFPIVWGLLYALMGISAARITLQPPSKTRSTGLNLFIVQLILNFFWSLLFFNAQAYGLSLLWLILLWITVLAMVIIFLKVDKAAGLLQIPYLLWLSFAVYLNYSVWQLN